jgi:hypothetical protein
MAASAKTITTADRYVMPQVYWVELEEVPDNAVARTGKAQMPQGQRQSVRPLGSLESFLANTHDRVGGSALCVSVVELEGRADPAAARAALRALVMRHPLLRARLERRDGAWWFVSDEAGPDAERLPLTFRTCPDVGEWQRVFDAEIDRSMPSAGPLWWATVLVDDRRTAFVLTRHHVIADGRSIDAIIRQFIDAHNAIVEGRTVDDRPFPVREPVERLLAATREAATAAPPPPSPITKAARWRFEQQAPLAERRTRLIWRVLDPPATEQFVRRCRAEGATVGSALIAIAVATAKVLPTHDDALSCLVPADVRGRVGVTGEECGVYFWDVPLTFAMTSDDQWERARGARAQFRKRMPAALARAREFTGQAGRHSTEAFDRGFVVTSLGRLDPGPADTPLRLTAFHRAGSQRSGAFAISMAMTTVGDRMCLSFTSPAPLLSDASASAFTDTFMTSLHAAA